VSLRSDCNSQEPVSGATFDALSQQVADSSYLIEVCEGVTDITITHVNYEEKKVSVNHLRSVVMTCVRK